MFKKNRNGFLLEDGLISVFIVSTLCTIASASVLSHYHIEESVEQQCLQEKQKIDIHLRDFDACILCTQEPVQNGQITEEPY